jgi:serine/threonine protein phosphatase 1
MVKAFEENVQGRDFVVGDIHGCFSKLQEVLDIVEFNCEVDRLFSVGDLVDRGPESEDCTEWLAKPWFHSVRGNHEDMAIDAFNGMFDKGTYLLNGGEWFLSLPDKATQGYYIEEFKKLPLVIEVGTPTGPVGIVHAECPLHDWFDCKRYAETLRMPLLWSRDRIGSKDVSLVSNISRIYVGHTPVKQPGVTLGNHQYIDTGAVFGRGFHLEQIN